MILVMVFCILAIILLIVIIARNSVIPKGSVKGTGGRRPKGLHILNLDQGGVFRIAGIGQDSETMELKVLAKHLYRQHDYSWFELECDQGTGDKIWMEVEDDDELLVSLVLKKLTLADLNVTPSFLHKADDDETGSITYDGKTFRYEDSDEATFYKYCDRDKSEKFYYWEFKSGKYSVSVEKWGVGEYTAFYSQLLSPNQITVYKNSDAE